MCGITGLVGTQPIDAQTVTTMRDRLLHRGPDDAGEWQSSDGLVALAHRRLSIVELSPLGHQPMESASGRYVLVYNGEIYNHQDIRAELERDGHAPPWRGHSDTETLLAAIDAWGLKRALIQAAGMFALALWDRRDRRLSLARDRFGEKPLYYGWVRGGFAFASEIGAIAAVPGFDNPIARDAVAALLSRAYIPAPASIYQRIYKLEPGCILAVDAGVAAQPQNAPLLAGQDRQVTRYWEYARVLATGLADPFTDPVEAEQTVERTLAAAVARQAVADVPVGAFLSGGIDSSTIVALYQAMARGTVRTFSIGFEEAGFNEAAYAKAVARHLGTDHHELYVSARDSLDVIPNLATMYGEPFADSSAIPTHIISRFARSQVTVALSGDAGDELFGGYNRYLAVPRLWQAMDRLPASLRRVVAGGAAQLPPALWDRLGSLAGGRARHPSFGFKVRKTLRTTADARDMRDVMESFLDEWHGQALPVLGHDGSRVPFPDTSFLPANSSALPLMYVDAITYLPDDILAKVDRAAMAVSLETRVPFLDPEVAAVAARLPISMRISGGETKRVLRSILARHVPTALFERPKAGFAIPVGEWLRGPLRDWAESLLDPRLMAEQGWLDAQPIRDRWDRHVGGRSDHTQSLWPVLMFQAWLAANQG